MGVERQALVDMRKIDMRMALYFKIETGSRMGLAVEL